MRPDDIAGRVELTLSQLGEQVGKEVAVSPWVLVDQSRIALFAEATGDRQWIHVDPQRAAASPYGGTIAHGFLTLSLIAELRNSCLCIVDATSSINYGLDKVRFPSPVPVDSRVRARFGLNRFSRLGADAAQATWEVSVERQGSDKLACFAIAISRFHC